MNSRFIIPILVIGAFAFACGPRPHTEASTPPAVTAAAAKPAPRRARTTRPAQLAPAFAVVPRRDGIVDLSLHIANAGDKSLELSFASGKTHDIAVLDEAGREVWRWSRGKLFTQALQTKMLGGGDTVSYEESWRPTSNAHGRFIAIATLNSTNFPVEQRLEFVIP